MLADRIKNESGYTLVEVMASIMILAIAIIPMVGMFDMGLKSATKGSTYDQARQLANAQLERAMGLSYSNVQSNFPTASPCTPFTSTGYCSSTVSVTDPSYSALPSGSTYKVEKQYICFSKTGNVNDCSLAGPNLVNAYSDKTNSSPNMIQITVTVNWSGNSYKVTGLKSP